MSAVRPIPTRSSPLRRLLLQLRVRFLRWEADVIRAERKQYEEIGAAGPVYCLNSLNAQLSCLREARQLEQGL